MFDFWRSLFGNQNREVLNVGLDCSLDLSLDRQAGKARFIKRYNTAPQSKVDEYFILYKEVYAQAEDILSELYKFYRDETDGKNRKNIQLEFNDKLLKKYNWLDKMNLTKLYRTACYYLK